MKVERCISEVGKVLRCTSVTVLRQTELPQLQLQRATAKSQVKEMTSVEMKYLNMQFIMSKMAPSHPTLWKRSKRAVRNMPTFYQLTK